MITRARGKVSELVGWCEACSVRGADTRECSEAVGLSCRLFHGRCANEAEGGGDGGAQSVHPDELVDSGVPAGA